MARVSSEDSPRRQQGGARSDDGFGRYGSSGTYIETTSSSFAGGQPAVSTGTVPGTALPNPTSSRTQLDSKPAKHGRLPLPRRFAYGVGHVFNDMCASLWFTYLLVFYHFVVKLPNTYAGTLLLIGQIFDAAATPVVGYLCDITRCRYGRRKIWHLVGTVMVACSLFFFWHKCLPCNQGTSIALLMLYYSVFIIIFQWGWAMVQISHLSLIPELTEDAHERVGLNAIRYAFTILSNVGVFAAMFLLLKFVGSESNQDKSNSTAVLYRYQVPYQDHSNTTVAQITPSDEWIFSGTALGVIAVGIFFSGIFHIGTREPSTSAEQRLEKARGRKMLWYKWFLKPEFYLVAVVYMCTRLVVNLTQAYTPLYLVDTLRMPKYSIAVGPLVVFVSGFIVTTLLKLLNRVIGRYMAYFLGLSLVWGSLLWLYAQEGNPADRTVMLMSVNEVYGAMVLLGAGTSTLLVTSLSMVADLIGCSVGSSAFVYGLMSFTDKLSNGIAIQVIQALHPCKGTICCAACARYYRSIVVFVPGGASVMAAAGLIFLVGILFMKRRRCRDVAPPVCTDPKGTVAAVHPCGGGTATSIQSEDDYDNDSFTHLERPIIVDYDKCNSEKRPLLD